MIDLFDIWPLLFVFFGVIKEVIDFDDDPAQRALDALERALDAHADKLAKAFKESTADAKETRTAVKNIGEETKGLGRIFDVSIGNIAAQAFQKLLSVVRAIPGFIVNLAKETASLGEIQSKYNTVFADSISLVDEYVRSQSALLGLTKSQARELLATTGAILQGAGLTKQASAEMSVEVARLAGDLASFNDAPITETFAALQAALTGERERLKQYGIVLNEAEVQQRALADSGKTTASSLTQQEKAVASLALIYEKAGVAVGDLNRTQDSGANQIRQAERNITQLAEEFRTGLAPAIDEVVTKINELSGDEALAKLARQLGTDLAEAIQEALRWFEENREEIGDNVEEVIELAKEIGGLISRLWELGEVIQTVLGSEDQGIVSFWWWLDRIQGTLENINSVIDLVITGLSKIADIQPNTPGRGRDITDGFAGDGSDPDNPPPGFKRNPLGGGWIPVRDDAPSSSGNDDDGGDNKPTITPAELKAIRTALDGLRSITEARRLAATFTKDQRQALADVFNLQERITKLKEIEKATGSKAAREELDLAEKALITAQAKLAVADAFAARIKAASDSFNGLDPKGTQGVLDFIKPQKPKSVLDDIKGGVIQSSALRQLDAKRVAEIERIVKLLDEAASSNEKWAEAMQSVGTSIRSIIQFADVFGDMNEDVRNIGLGIADVLDNAGGLQDLIEQGKSGLALAPGAIGVAAGIASTIGGIVSALSENTKAEREAAEAQQRATDDLVAALNDSARAFERFAAGQLKADVIGDSFSGSDLARAQDLYQQLAFASGNTQATRDIIAQLIDLGFADESFSGIFEQWLASGASPANALAEALKATRLAEFLEDLADRFADFGDTLNGVLKEIQINANFGGLDVQGQLALFLERIAEADVELGTDLERILQEQLGDIDLSTQAGQDKLRELIRQFADAFTNQGQIDDDSEYPNPFAGNVFGDVFAEISPDQFEDLLNFLQSLTGSGGSGAVDGESQSAVYNRSITEVQANEISAYLEQIAFATLGMYRLMGGGGEPPSGERTPGSFGGAGPHWVFPDPSRPTAGTLSPGHLAAQYLGNNQIPSTAPDVSTIAGGGLTVVVYVGGVQAAPLMSRAQLDEVAQIVGGAVAAQIDQDIDSYQNRSF